MRRHTWLSVITLVATAVAAPVIVTLTASAAVPATSISAPQNLAAVASLTPGTTKTFNVTVSPAGAAVYLKITTTPGGGSASVGGTQLGAGLQAFVSDGTGVVQVSYTTPSTLPLGGKDVITSTNAISAATVTKYTTYSYTPVTHFQWSPEPIASPGSLPPSTSTSFSATALNAKDQPVPNAQICVLLAKVTGGGSASIGATALTGSFQCFVSDNTGSVSIVYTTPVVLPVTGTDIVYAQDAVSTYNSRSFHGYSFGALASLSWSSSPIAASGSLGTSKTVTITLTPADSSGNQVAGATVYLSLLQGSGATAVVTNAAAPTTPVTLTSTPQKFVTHTTTKLTVAYKTPATLPGGGTDLVIAGDAASAPTISATDSYSFAATTPAPPIVTSATLSPSEPTTDSQLTVVPMATSGSGNPLSFTYQWQRFPSGGNGFADISGATGATLDLSQPGNGDKGDQLRVVVAALDGSVASTLFTSAAVTVVNSLPVTVPVTAATSAGTPLTVDVAASATDADGDPLSLTAASVQTLGAGTAQVLTSGPDAGQVTFTPSTTFTGDAVVGYTLTDGTDSSTGTLTVTVSGSGSTAPPPPSINCTANQWAADYFANRDLSGPPAGSRCEASVYYAWGSGGPTGVGVGVDNFSARWTRTLSVSSPLSYLFTTVSDDGVRLYVDGTLVIDNWTTHAQATNTATVPLGPGAHTVVVEYFEATGSAVARVSIQSLPTCSSWRAEYYNNRTLFGAPSSIRCESAVNYSWGTGGPSGVGVGTDNFSVRWTTSLTEPSGALYTFTTTSDDGIRVKVDGNWVINDWTDHTARVDTGAAWLTASVHQVVVEYYEHTGPAVAQVTIAH